MELGRAGKAFIIGSMPVPVCKRKRARRCRKVRGRMFCGYCAAKGLPAHFVILPAALHDLTPIYELSYELPASSALYGDKAYNDGDAEDILQIDGIRLIPVRRKNMKK